MAIGLTKHWPCTHTPALHGSAALKQLCFSRAPSQSTTGSSVTVVEVPVAVVKVVVDVDVTVDVVVTVVVIVVVVLLDDVVVVVVTVELSGRVSQYSKPSDGFDLMRQRSWGQSFTLYSKHLILRGVVVVVVVIVVAVVVVIVDVIVVTVVVVIVVTVVVVNVVVLSTQKSAPLNFILSQRFCGQHSISLCPKQPVFSSKSEQSASLSPSSLPLFWF
jgi:hypothetical protein